MADNLLLESYWDRLPRGYRRTYTVIEGQGLYWHLFYGDTRVNGGLVELDEHDQAVAESRRCAWAHYYSRQPLRVPRERHRWDDWDD